MRRLGRFFQGGKKGKGRCNQSWPSEQPAIVTLRGAILLARQFSMDEYLKIFFKNIKWLDIGWQKTHFCDFWGPKNFFGTGNFVTKNTHITVILCGESIYIRLVYRFRAFSKHKNAFLTLIQGMELVYCRKNFYFLSESIHLGVILCGKSIAHIF
jgi:hypothetical protein